MLYLLFLPFLGPLGSGTILRLLIIAHPHAGGLVCRGILENYPLNIRALVSLSSPHAGQYGGKQNI